MSEMRFVRNERGREQLVIEDAALRFHNFAGEQTEFNAKGNRNIDVILPDPEMAVAMGEKGWNVKIRKPRDPEGDPYYTLNIKLNLDSRWPPDFYQHNKRNTLDITLRHYMELYPDDPARAKREFENAVSNLDSINMNDICVVINGSEWESQMGHGIKAYLDQYHFRLAPTLFGDYYNSEEESELETEDVPF